MLFINSALECWCFFFVMTNLMFKTLWCITEQTRDTAAYCCLTKDVNFDPLNPGVSKSQFVCTTSGL